MADVPPTWVGFTKTIFSTTSSSNVSMISTRYGVTLFRHGPGMAFPSIRYLFQDEVDKYPGASKKEADPVSLAIERTKTYTTNRKIFITSTPTLKTGHIWKAKEEADAEKHYFVPCPHCGQYIELKFAQIKWPSKDDVPDNAERAEMASYVCQACECVITDQDKGKMLEAGRWEQYRQFSCTSIPAVSSLVHSGSSQAGTSVWRSITRSALVFSLVSSHGSANHERIEICTNQVAQ